MRAPLKEYQAVEAAAMKFVKSVAEGNSKYAKELFIDEAVLFGYLDGNLEHGSIEQFYHNVDTVPGGDNFQARVDVLLVRSSPGGRPRPRRRLGKPHRLYRCAVASEDERRMENVLPRRITRTPTRSRSKPIPRKAQSGQVYFCIACPLLF